MRYYRGSSGDGGPTDPLGRRDGEGERKGGRIESVPDTLSLGILYPGPNVLHGDH